MSLKYEPSSEHLPSCVEHEESVCVSNTPPCGSRTSLRVSNTRCVCLTHPHVWRRMTSREREREKERDRVCESESMREHARAREREGVCLHGHPRDGLCSLPLGTLGFIHARILTLRTVSFRTLLDTQGTYPCGAPTHTPHFVCPSLGLYVLYS